MANDKDRSFSVDDGIRKKNMKVLVMGMGRTGTTGDNVEYMISSISSD